MVSNATSQVNYSKLGKKLAVDAKMIKAYDFYLNTVLYQVSYDSEDTQTRSREFEGLKYFLEKLKKEKAYLVTYDRDEVAECNDTEIEVMRVDRFLLNLSTVIHSENIK